MTEAKHTPGPWYAFSSPELGDSRAVGVTPVARGLCDVAYCDIGATRSDAEKQANARLIAAAPELLAELRNFVNGVETGMIDSPADDILANVTRRARAAISKATGGGE